jgi:hypothetical protein
MVDNQEYKYYFKVDIFHIGVLSSREVLIMRKVLFLTVTFLMFAFVGCDDGDDNNANNINNVNNVNNVNNTNNINNINNTNNVSSCDGQLCDGHGACAIVDGAAVCACEECYGYADNDPLTCFYYGCDDKPIIYIYPTEPTDVTVKFVDLDSLSLSYTYPEYGDDGWKVRAFPDGTLYDSVTDMEYYALYWEGTLNHVWDITKGTVVAGVDTVVFLEEALEKLGLTRREANEFIIYWLPRLESNPYNLIHFSTTQWSQLVPLDITPLPDNWVRFLMVFKPLDVPVTVEPQEFQSFSRVGFTVVEWGGTELK